jgi:hypothetical protein
VTHSSRQAAETFTSKMDLVKVFMNNVKKAGFGVVIVHRRHNTLAMLISDFELKYKRKDLLYGAFEEQFTDVVSIIQYNFLALEVGHQEALKLRLPVIETDFKTMAGASTCGEFSKIFKLLHTYDLIPADLVNSCKQVSVCVWTGV